MSYKVSSEKSFHNLNPFKSSTGLDPQHHESSSSSTSTNSNDCYIPTSPLNVLKCNSGSRSLFMTSDNNNHSPINNLLRIPDAVSAPPSPSNHYQHSFKPISSSTPPSPILSNKISTGFVGNINNNDICVKIVETDPLEKRFVLYRVEVTLNGQKWFVRRRYSEFHHLLEVVSI